MNIDTTNRFGISNGTAQCPKCKVKYMIYAFHPMPKPGQLCFKCGGPDYSRPNGAER